MWPPGWLAATLLEYFGRAATPGKTFTTGSCFSLFVDNSSHCGSLESQSLRNCFVMPASLCVFNYLYLHKSVMTAVTHPTRTYCCWLLFSWHPHLSTWNSPAVEQYRLVGGHHQLAGFHIQDGDAVFALLFFICRHKAQATVNHWALWWLCDTGL